MADLILVLVLFGLAYAAFSMAASELGAGDWQQAGAWGGISVLIVLAIVGCLPGAAPPALPVASST